MLSLFPPTIASLSSSIPYPHHIESRNGSLPSDSSAPPPPAAEPPVAPASDLNENTSPLLHCFLAGGLGGAVGDSVMHSLDTVKTRQQGLPSTVKYRNTVSAYLTILREEGFARGLYGGYGAAMLGSFPSAAIFFVTYESTKRVMIEEFQIPETFTHLTAGFLGDFASSIFYVPSEVLKTRLQLQGRVNNPFFNSGYNYKSTFDAIMTICKAEGPGTLFYGYKATLVRDLPFSALQLAFYEKFRDIAFRLTQEKDKKRGDELTVASELLVGASAGGLAGIITTPCDVIKTRVQTQQQEQQKQTHLQQKSKQLILSSSIWNSLKTVAKQEGIFGLFSGVGPRFVWTSVQSSIMLFLYQLSLRQFDRYLLLPPPPF